jgi:1,4-dihydroxy-2-naphthoate octaprenyltransferase
MKTAPYRWLDAWILMRIPFSVFLMPIFWYTLAFQKQVLPRLPTLFIFIILHVLVYPASNGYNSYFDKDTGSIGGLKTPPPVNPALWILVISFDIAAVVAACMINWYFGLMIFMYLMVSKAYSYDKIRLKKYPIISTVVVTLFQGFFTSLSIQIGLKLPFSTVLRAENMAFAIVGTFFLAGSYPMTQIYQHQEDAARGDKTLSLLLGLKGTFIFAGIAFLAATSLLSYLYICQQRDMALLAYFIGIVPILLFFSYWAVQVWHNCRAANFSNTMRLNQISSLALSAIFALTYYNHW